MESKIQKSIIKQLEKKGYLVLKTIQLSQNGFPDIMALKNGKTVFIEVKDKGKKPSKLQLYRINQLKENGFFACWLDNNCLPDNL